MESTSRIIQTDTGLIHTDLLPRTTCIDLWSSGAESVVVSIADNNTRVFVDLDLASCQHLADRLRQVIAEAKAAGDA